MDYNKEIRHRARCLHCGDEIDEWLSGCDEEVEYIIIDDMDASAFNEYQVSRLLVVSPYTGQDEDTANRAVNLLGRNPK